MIRSSRSCSAHLLACLTLLGLLASTPASGGTQGPPSMSDRRAAVAHYRRGAAAMKARRFDEAIAAFEAARALDPSATLLYNIARALEEKGEVGAALTAFERYLDEPNGVLYRKEALRHMAELRKRLVPAPDFVPVPVPNPAQPAFLTVEVSAPGASVTIGGKRGFRSGDPVSLPAGRYTVSASAPGRVDATTEVTLVAGQRLALTLSPASIPHLLPPVDPGPERTAGPWRWVTLGTGLALVATGAVLSALSQRDYDEVRGARRDENDVIQVTQTQARADQESGDAKGFAAGALYGTGGAALLSSLVLFIAGR